MESITIKEIESLTEQEVIGMNPDKEVINGHNVYMVDLSGYFGFSALVFREGKHLYYANDYELHHKHMTREELISWYRETMSNKLFSDEMISEPIKDYQNGEAKDNYLRNYYPLMCEDKVSAFNIFHKEQERKEHEKRVKGLTFSRIGFFYTSNKDFVNKLNDLYITAQKSKEGKKDNYEYWLNAFKYEMFNHEYAISWEPDTSTLSAFGLPFDIGAEYENRSYSKGLNYLFDALEFSDTQRRAYMDARSYVLSESEY